MHRKYQTRVTSQQYSAKIEIVQIKYEQKILQHFPHKTAHICLSIQFEYC